MIPRRQKCHDSKGFEGLRDEKDEGKDLYWTLCRTRGDCKTA